MKNIFLNRAIKNFILLFLTIFFTEMIFKIVMNMPILEWSMLRVALGIGAISFLLSIVYSFLGRIIGNVLVVLTALISTSYALLQAGFENYLGVYVSISSSTQAGAVKDYINDFIKSFDMNFLYILAPFIMLIIYFIVFERKTKNILANKRFNFLALLGDSELEEAEFKRVNGIERDNLWLTRVVFTIFTVVCAGTFYYSLSADFMQNKLQLVSTKSLFKYPEMPNIAVNQFGVSIFGILDVKAAMLPNKDNNHDESLEKPEQEITDYTRYIDDSGWEKANETEKNSNYKTLNNYYLSKEITPKNDYTGMFKDKNLVVVFMESVNTIAVNEEYFPNIYKLYNEGWAWDNAFSPRNNCSTGNNEMSGMTSLYTINLNCTVNMYAQNKYYNAIFNLFNRDGYETSSYHDYTEQYYTRKIYNPNMGSNKFYGVSDLGIKYNPVYQEWPSDVLLMDKASDIFLKQDKFMSWITTVSPHQPYYLSSELGNMYLDEFESTGYDITLKRYMSKLKVLDDAIGKLLEKLEEAGELDDTVILLYADHYPYGLNNSTLNDYFDYNVSVNNEVDRTPFIIYNTEITPTKFDEYTSFMNILPTVANLFDLNYDPRIYAGTDLFSETYQNRVVFADGSWQNDIAFYNASLGKISYYGSETYTDQEIIDINKEVVDNIKMSNLAIKSDYFEYLHKVLLDSDSVLVSYKKEEPTVEEDDTKEPIEK